MPYYLRAETLSVPWTTLKHYIPLVAPQSLRPHLRPHEDGSPAILLPSNMKEECLYRPLVPGNNAGNQGNQLLRIC